MRQKAAVECENVESQEMQIGRGARQGCVLSSVLFSVSSEAIFKRALTGKVGIYRSGISTMRTTLVLISESMPASIV